MSQSNWAPSDVSGFAALVDEDAKVMAALWSDFATPDDSEPPHADGIPLCSQGIPSWGTE